MTVSSFVAACSVSLVVSLAVPLSPAAAQTQAPEGRIYVFHSKAVIIATG